MKHSLFFCIAIFAFLSMVSCQTPTSSEGRVVDLLVPEAFMEAYEEESTALLIDCRTPAEVSRGTIEGAMNLDFRSPTFLADAEKLDKSQPVYVYCQAGGRSAAAAEELKTLGFKEVHDMKGGYGAFIKK
ncbi:MAG: rhodanese-like domain-containing protein [Saprospiraceae bacterium]